MNSHTTATAPVIDHPDGFADAVHDLLGEYVLTHHVLETKDVDELTAQITDAYVPRIKGAREQAARASRETRTLLERERAIYAHLAQMTTTLEQLTRAGVRHAAQVRVLNGQLTEARELIARVRENGDHMVSAAELTVALEPRRMPLNPPPMMVSVVVDTRWTAGIFASEGGGDRRYSYPFIGWSSVLRSDTVDAAVEAVFLVDGQEVPQSLLARRGLTLENLLA